MVIIRIRVGINSASLLTFYIQVYQMDDRPNQDISNEKEKIKEEDKEEVNEEQPEQPKSEEIIEHPEH